ncbi:MAG: 1-deoxy-D-xylulose-5-phosphate reductoisomerase [Bacilli bacterium]|nr:1-deoxy-D-xylulose-5-phosphate reductoisomerase [Bacilli bacterium]
MKNIFLLGASGSIGTQTLDIISNNSDFCLKSISIGKNIKRATSIIKEFKPEFVGVSSKEDMLKLVKEFPEVEFGYGEEGLIKAATYGDEGGFLINAVVGMVGLVPTIAAIKKKRDILLANKETLVTGGEIIMKLVEEYQVKLFPIDSEHSAIYQCLISGRKEDVSRIIITASGGAFRDKTRDELVDVTLEEALHHPNWSMGNKITVDCATMVNKGLEVIEAHYLFDMPYEKIETIIHPESIIHSMVEYKDGSTMAQMSVPNMMLPIQYALYHPRHRDNISLEKIDFNSLGSISFRKMDFLRYPMIKMAYEVGKKGGLMPTVYNAANEAAVDLFIQGKIKFIEIENIIKEMVLKYQNKNIAKLTLESILKMDLEVKEDVYGRYEVK